MKFTANEVVEIDETKLAIIFKNGGRVVIDSEDYDLVKDYRWREYRGKTNITSYAVCTTSAKVPGVRTSVLMHKLILRTDCLIDHKDQNGLNNCKDNLRVATPAQNSSNKNKLLRNSSGYIGVWRDKVRKKWVAEISSENKKKFLGYFDSSMEAALARDRAALELHKEFAVLNFPIGGKNV